MPFGLAAGPFCFSRFIQDIYLIHLLMANSKNVFVQNYPVPRIQKEL